MEIFLKDNRFMNEGLLAHREGEILKNVKTMFSFYMKIWLCWIELEFLLKNNLHYLEINFDFVLTFYTTSWIYTLRAFAVHIAARNSCLGTPFERKFVKNFIYKTYLILTYQLWPWNLNYMWPFEYTFRPQTRHERLLYSSGGNMIGILFHLS